MAETSESGEAAPRAFPWKKLALVGVVAAIFGTAYHLGVFSTFRDPEHLRQALLELGSLGFVAYVLAFAFVQPFGVPGVAFVIGAGLVWPPPIAIVLSMVGATWSSVNGFSFSRYLARDWVEKRLPARLRKYDDRLERRGFLTVFVLRLFFMMSAPLTLAFGISRVRFTTHLAASMSSYFVTVVLFTYLGEAAIATLKAQPRERWILAGGVLALAMTVRFFWRRRRLGETRSSSPPPPADP